MSLLGNVEDLQRHSEEDQEAIRGLHVGAEVAAVREKQLQQQLHALQSEPEKDQEALQSLHAAAAVAAACDKKHPAKVQDLQQSAGAGFDSIQNVQEDQQHDNHPHPDEDDQAQSSFQRPAASSSAMQDQVCMPACDVSCSPNASSSMPREAHLQYEQHQQWSEANLELQSLKQIDEEVKSMHPIANHQTADHHQAKQVPQIAKATLEVREEPHQLACHQTPDMEGHLR